ncbi:MAG: ABC transporter permease [Clostridiales bacterium]|nr:ABC transporter permease [Clostridiales bacterium]
MDKINLKKLINAREVSLFIVLILFGIFIQLRNPAFGTPKNINNMLINYSTTMVLAIGMMSVLLIGGIDISIGSILAFAGMVSALVIRDNPDTSVFVAIMIAVIVGGLCGLINGLVIAKGGVPPIIATMGSMNILRGLTYLVANNEWVAAYQINEGFKKFAMSKYLSFGLINNLIFIAFVIALVAYCFLKYTRLGRKIYAVGNNAQAAEISGINISRIKILVYTLMGILAGLSGALWVSLYASAQGDMGMGIEMDVIAACVIGGVSLAGGRGSVVGVLLGAITIAMLGNGLPLIGVSQFSLDAIKGAIIVLTVILNVLLQRQKLKNSLRRREI